VEVLTCPGRYPPVAWALVAKTVSSPPSFFADLKDLVSSPESHTSRWLVLAGVVTVVAGVALRFYCPSPLWLDETISVNISRLPISQIPTALSHDGAPPLYYVMLHFWMVALGEGTFAVRAFSALASVAALPFFWYAGRRLGGRRVGWIVFFLAVTNPFAIYYATDTRQYSLLVLLSVLGFLALARALEAPTPGRLVALGLVTTALLYTHYWALYLVGVTGLWLLYQLWRHHRGLPTQTEQPAVVACFAAVLAGSLLFIPWAPIFVFQALHTGTPWTGAASPASLLGIFNDYAGSGPWAELLALAYYVLVVLGVFGRRQPEAAPGTGAAPSARSSRRTSGYRHSPGSRLEGGPDGVAGGGADGLDGAGGLEEPELPRGARAGMRAVGDRVVGFAGFGPGGAGAAARREEGGGGIGLVLQPNRRAMPIFGVFAGTLVAAVVGGVIVNAAFVARYAAVVLPLFLLLVGLGVALLSRPRLVAGTLGVLCLAGLLTGYGNNSQLRTEAGKVAGVLNVEARPGDLVLFCPDQLGPAVNRLVHVPGLTELTFPRAIGPQRVDWVNYRQVIDHTNVEDFAQEMLADVAPGHTIWLVWQNGYPGFGGDCGELANWLSLLKGQGTTVLTPTPGTYETENLTKYPTN